MMDRRRIRGIATAIGATALCLAGLPTAASASVNLGAIGFGAVVVDAPHAHVFVSGPKGNVIEELSYSGSVLATISVPSPQGMAISGHYLYVTESAPSPSGAVARIDLSAATPTVTTLATGLNSPQWLAVTGGKLWVTEASSFGSGWGNVAAVDPASGQVTEFPNNSSMQMIYEPDLATSPGDPSTLFIASDGGSPGQVYRVDVSTGTPANTATSHFGDTSNIQTLAVSYDGSRVIPAAGATQDASGYTHYQFLEYSGSGLTADGVIYPGSPYPSAVATSQSGLLATGLDHGSLTGSGGQPISDINVFPLGASTPTFSATTANSSGTANVRPHGLALQPAGTFLFAVTSDDVYDTNTIFNSFPLRTLSNAAPAISCGAPPTTWQNVNVTITCTATDNSGSGLADPTDASFALSTSVPAGSSNASATTGSHTVCDNTGNCATAGPIGPIKVDLAAPTVTITSPANGSTVKQKSTLVARYSCADQGSGLASCTGTVANGATISTQQTGTFAFTVTGKDVAGNVTTTTVHYTVSKH
jgi:hypothetical protein